MNNADDKPVLALVAVRTTDQDMVPTLVGRLREILYNDPNAPETLKGRDLEAAPGAYELLADTVKQRCAFEYLCLDNKPDRTAVLVRLVQGYVRMLERNAWAWDALGVPSSRVDFIRQQLQRQAKRPSYLGLLMMLLTKLARWFRARETLPLLEVVLDEGRLRNNDQALRDFILRAPFFGVFEGLTEHWPQGLLGVGPDMGITCRLGRDPEDLGIILADAIAYAASRVERGLDAGGRLRDLLVRMGGRHPTSRGTRGDTPLEAA